jgi:glycosyltransferase involved in cell wall biosynthesis
MTIPTIKTLFITKMSYPPIGGVAMRNWQNITIMQKFGPVAIFAVSDQNCTIDKIDGIAVWHHYYASEDSSLLLKIQRGIWWLRLLGLNDFWGYIQPAAKQLNHMMKEFQPDLVIVEELWLYHYLSVIKKYPCRIIFDQHNIEANLFQTIKCSEPNFRTWVRKRLHLPQIKFIENTFIQKSDQVWVCSDQDEKLLKILYGEFSHSYVIPNSINIDYYQSVYLERSKSFNNTQKSQLNILFPGHFGYLPNIEAAQLLIEKIYPKIREIYPDCRLLLVGREPTNFMQEASHKNPNIIVTGEVADMRPYLTEADIMIVPLQKGSGTRFKILEAFASGCPVISTKKGAEGLKAEDDQHLLIRDNIEDIVTGVIELLTKPHVRQELSHRAYEQVQKEYSWQAVGDKIELAISQLFNNI